MKYWPISAVIESIHMPPQFAAEFREMVGGNKGKVVSEMAFYHAFHVVASMPGRKLEQLIFQPNDKTSDRRFYLDYPETNDWLVLERGGVYENEEGYRFLFIDALH